VPLNSALVGRTYPPTRVFEVGREHLRRFADAIGDPDPAYRDPAAARALGHADVVAPPTFLMALVSAAGGREALADPELGLDRSRVVHAEQRFEHHRPVVAGDRLVLTATVDDVRDLGANELLTLRHEITTEDGAPVCTASFVVLSRGTGQGR
jgi:acyl dehydratase